MFHNLAETLNKKNKMKNKMKKNKKLRLILRENRLKSTVSPLKKELLLIY